MKSCPSCHSQFPPGSNYCPFDGHQLEDSGLEASAADDMIGQVVDGRYRIESRLGMGGMGEVYAARHVVIEKLVALKVLRREHCDDPRQTERFMREARAASHIGHSNIVDVTDFGRLENGRVYYVMEFLNGVTLARELRTCGPLSARRAINLALQACRALQAAHAKGIVHRDLKPDNIFIVNPLTAATPSTAGVQQDLIKVLDFGIAKITWDVEGRRLTRAGSIFGTPQYMSPEQAAGQEIDQRGDIYAMGCIIYEMLTGEAPFVADTYMGTLTKHMFEIPVPPRKLRPDLRIPEPLEEIILRALQKDPDQRFQTMQDLIGAIGCSLRAYETGPVQPLRPEGRPAEVASAPPALEVVHLLEEPSSAPPLPSRASRQRGWWPIAAGLALLGLGALYLALRHPSTSRSLQVLDARAPLAAPVHRDGSSAALRDLAMQTRNEVVFELQSEPAGATVIEHNQSLGKTPYRARLSAGSQHSFVLRKAGFHEKLIQTPVLTEPRFTYSCELQRLAARPSRRWLDAGPRGPSTPATPPELRNPFAPRRPSAGGQP